MPARKMGFFAVARGWRLVDGAKGSLAEELGEREAPHSPEPARPRRWRHRARRVPSTGTRTPVGFGR